MRLIVIALFLLSGVFSLAAESKLVDVDKNSKLSDYFQKINKKVSDNSEDNPLVSVKPQKEEAKDPVVAEEDILLKEATAPVKESTMKSPSQKMVLAMVVLLVMAGLFFISVKKMGKKQGYSAIAQNIKILTQKSIGPKKNLMLVRVAGETILLGVTDHSINHIKTLSLMDDELPQYTEPKFAKQFSDKIAKANEEPSILDREPEEVDGYAISDLNDVKSALKRYTI